MGGLGLADRFVGSAHRDTTWCIGLLPLQNVLLRYTEINIPPLFTAPISQLQLSFFAYVDSKWRFPNSPLSPAFYIPLIAIR